MTYCTGYFGQRLNNSIKSEVALLYQGRSIVATNDEQQYQYMLQHIRNQSPKTAEYLTQIYVHDGVQAGYYAAIALVWLMARKIALGERGLTDFSDRTLKRFTYFHELQDQPELHRAFQNPASDL